MNQVIPTIDLSPVVSGMSGGDAHVARELDAALRSWGAFSLIGHGVDMAALGGAFGAARRFFAQSMQAREALKVNKNNRGYVPMHQTVYEGNLPDLKESFNLGLPLQADDPDVVAGKPLHGVNVWPDLPGYRADVERYFEQMMALGDRLLGPLAICLGMQPEALRALYRKPIAFMRLFHYPPTTRLAEREHGAAEHQDYGFLTILAQDNAGGLEVRAPDGSIIGVEPRTDAFVVNAGDMLARITGGALLSAPHRVINRSGVGRYSIPFFFDPDFDARFAGMPDMSAGEFLLFKFNKFYAYRKSVAETS
jgi:isopenicillin N synthase-like dioxygenase